MDDDARQGDLHHPSRSEAADACGRTILDCITDPIFACDADWRLIYLNAGAALLFGAAPEAILGRRAGDLLPRAEAGVLEAVFRRAAGRVCEGEIDRTALGRHLLLRCFPCPEGGLCVHCQDITDRRAHEQALQTSAEQYRSVVEDQNEIICRHRPGDGCYTFVNRGFCRFFGRSREELLGRAWHAEAVPEDRPLIRTLLARISPEHPVVTVENRVYDRDGQIRWLQVDNRGIFDERDRLVEIQAVGRDITDRKQMELQLRRAEASARNLFEVNLDPLLIIGVDGRIVDINRASTKASGYTREEIVGSDFRAYVVDRDQALAGFWRVFEEGAVRDLPLDIRYRDGRVVPTLCNAALLHEEDGQVAGILVSVHNITELKQAEEELKAINAELERRVEARTHELQETQKKYLHAEKLSAIGQLSASIAHEFNNPLQGIMTVLKGLYRRAVLEPEDRALLAMAIDESERMKDLIRSLQDFNRPSSGLRGRMDLHACLDSLLLF